MLPGSRFNRWAKGKKHKTPRSGMNSTEAKYAERLELQRRAGEIAWFMYEGLKFRLADNTFYSPDFAVMLADGTLEMHEVKGYWEDASRIKIKVAADRFPIRFIAVKALPKKDGGGWKVEEFGDAEMEKKDTSLFDEERTDT